MIHAYKKMRWWVDGKFKNVRKAIKIIQGVISQNKINITIEEGCTIAIAVQVAN